jgi:hypothetical protein
MAAEEHASPCPRAESTVRAMAGLLPKEEKEDSSGDELIRLDPYYVFDWYFP